MVPVDDERDESDYCHRVHHRLVTEDGTSGASCQHLRNDAERRHDDDVDLRVSEVPEQVSPEQWIASRSGIVESRGNRPVEEGLDEADAEGWNGDE